MKVSLVRPSTHLIHKQGGGKREYKKLPPKFLMYSEVELGLLYVAAYLEQAEHDVRVCDLQISQTPDRDYERHLAEFQPDVVGITAYTGFIDISNRHAEQARAAGAVTLAGGHHPSALPEKTLDEFPGFDYVIHGEGEHPMVDFANALADGGDVRAIPNLGYRENGEARVNPMRPPMTDLDDILYPARHLVDLHAYNPIMNDYVVKPHTNILASRGCPFVCNFCSRTGSRHDKRKYYFRSAESLVEEMDFVYRQWGVRDFRFVDDTFTYDRVRLEDLCDRLIAGDIKYYWSCYSRSDEVDEPILRKMKKAGCFHIKFGFEVGSERMVKQIGKEFTLEESIEAARLTRKVGIEFFSGFIFGFPGESVEEMEQTMNFALKLSPDVAAFQSLVAFPGSQIYNHYAKRNQLMSHEYKQYMDTAHRVLPDQAIHGKALEAYVRRAFRRFYLRPAFILQKLRRILVGNPRREIRNLLLGMVELFGT